MRQYPKGKMVLPASIWCFFADASSGASGAAFLNTTGPREIDASPVGSRRLA